MSPFDKLIPGREIDEYDEQMKKFKNEYLAGRPVIGHLANGTPLGAFFICFLISPWIMAPIQIIIGELSISSITRYALIMGIIGAIISYFMGKELSKKTKEERQKIIESIISKRKENTDNE
jgi:predicted membrane protein